MRDAHQLERELALLQDRIRVQAAERDLRGPDQIQVRIGDGVDLRLRAARAEGEAVHDLPARQVGRGEGGESLAHCDLEGEALEGELEQHGRVLQEVELLAGDSGPRFEVE